MLNRPSGGSRIEWLLDQERWADARAQIRKQLKEEPDSHWLVTRLSVTYYEERRYRMAVRYSEKAFRLAPECPLVLWDHAGHLQALGRHREALNLYARIVSLGVDGLMASECSEGRAKARGLVSDANYRASQSLAALGYKEASESAFDQCLDLRGPGCRSIYTLEELQ